MFQWVAMVDRGERVRSFDGMFFIEQAMGGVIFGIIFRGSGLRVWAFHVGVGEVSSDGGVFGS